MPFLFAHPVHLSPPPVSHIATKAYKYIYIYIPKNLLRRSICWNLPFAGSCQGKVYCSNLNVSSDQNCHFTRRPAVHSCMSRAGLSVIRTYISIGTDPHWGSLIYYRGCSHIARQSVGQPLNCLSGSCAPLCRIYLCISSRLADLYPFCLHGPG